LEEFVCHEDGELARELKKITNFPCTSSLEKFVDSYLFGVISSMAIITNACYIGYEANFMVKNELSFLYGQGRHALTPVPEYCFTVFFVIELLMRVAAQKKAFLFGKDVTWNMIDFTLIVISLVQILTAGSSGGGLTVFRIFRIFRLVRLLKVMRRVQWLQSLNLMVLGILRSLTPLLWATLLLVIIMYSLAVFFISATATHLSTLDPSKVDVDQDVTQVVNSLEEDFGSMYMCLCVLFESVTGGNDWAIFARELRPMGEVYYVCFSLYVVFVTLGVLNIFTGFFVEGTVEASSETKFQFMKQREVRRAAIAELIRDLCHQSDTDFSGTLNKAEFEARQDWFSLLNIEAADTSNLFALLDDDGVGEVSIDDFVNGCITIMGPPRSFDMCICLHQNKLAMGVMERILASVERTNEEVAKWLV